MKIQRVPPNRRREALQFVVAGAGRDEAAAARLEAFYVAAEGAGHQAAHLWWARRRGRCLAAAMVLARPGRTGMLFRPSAHAPGVDTEALAAVIHRAAEAALAGLYMVQAFVSPGAHDDLAVLEAAGLGLLVELVNLRLDLPVLFPPDGAEASWAWSCRGYEKFDDSELGEVISATYAGSLDCPALCGLRPMADVLAAHKTSGVFRPQSWWVFDLDGQPAGCILVNGVASSPDLMEVVYLGVCPPFRGKGLGRRMLRYAIERVTQDGAAAVKLATDSRNIYARRIYDEAGFCQTDQVLVMARMRPPPAQPDGAQQVENL